LPKLGPFLYTAKQQVFTAWLGRNQLWSLLWTAFSLASRGFLKSKQSVSNVGAITAKHNEACIFSGGGECWVTACK